MKALRFLCLFAMVALACTFATSLPLVEKLTASPTPNPFSYTISGSLHPARETTVPRNTRALIMWMVSEGEDHGYIFGEGKLDFRHYRFTIHFDGPPPPEALNVAEGVNAGIGYIILTTNQDLEGRVDSDSFVPDEIMGIAPNHAVIFIDGDIESLADPDWVRNFHQGYNVGRAVPQEDRLDTFELVSPDSILIIIDDLKNITIADWW